MSEDVQVKVRIPREVKEHVEKKAEESYRSINSEVLYRLEQFRKIESLALEKKAREFSQILTLALIEDDEVECVKDTYGIKRPTLKGIQKAFELFKFKTSLDRDEFKCKKDDEGLYFYIGEREYVIRYNNKYSISLSPLDHLVGILEKLYFRPMLGLVDEN